MDAVLPVDDIQAVLPGKRPDRSAAQGRARQQHAIRRTAKAIEKAIIYLANFAIDTIAKPIPSSRQLIAADYLTVAAALAAQVTLLTSLRRILTGVTQADP